MCSHPITIKNPSEYVNLRATAYTYTVPCGHCVECHQDKVNGYVLRAHTEFLNASAKGGYFLFDTLTYSNEFLPTVFGLPCFSHRDISLFKKRVENDLVARGFGRENSVKFFVTSEFGGDFHRPHYHIAFFVYNPEITPMILDEIINKNWRFFDREKGKLPFDPFWRMKHGKNCDLGIGFTDIESPGARVFRCPPGVDTTVSAQNVIGYITGYTVKEDDYRWYHNNVLEALRKCCGKTDAVKLRADGKSLRRAVYQDIDVNMFLYEAAKYPVLAEYLDNFKDISSADYALQRAVIMKSDIEPFIQSSLEFGSSLMDGVKDDEKALADFFDSVQVPDQLKGKKSIRTPQYYKKKLFYDHFNEKLVKVGKGFEWRSTEDAKGCECVLDEDTGKPVRRVRWELNDLGIKFKSMKIKDKQKRFARFVEDIVKNTVDGDLSHIIGSYVNIDRWPKTSFELLKLFSGRIDEFARYKLLFKDRIFARSVLDTFEGDDIGLLLFVLSDKDSSYIYRNSVLFVPRREHKFKVPLSLDSSQFLFSSGDLACEVPHLVAESPDLFTSDTFDECFRSVDQLSQLVGDDLVRCDDTFCDEWHDFDMMDDVFNYLIFIRGVQKTKEHREKAEKRRKYKNERVKSRYRYNHSKIA